MKPDHHTASILQRASNHARLDLHACLGLHVRAAELLIASMEAKDPEERQRLRQEAQRLIDAADQTGLVPDR